MRLNPLQQTPRAITWNLYWPMLDRNWRCDNHAIMLRMRAWLDVRRKARSRGMTAEKNEQPPITGACARREWQPAACRSKSIR